MYVNTLLVVTCPIWTYIYSIKKGTLPCSSELHIFSGVEAKLIILDKIDVMYICTYDDDLKFNRDGVNVATSK